MTEKEIRNGKKLNLVWRTLVEVGFIIFGLGYLWAALPLLD